MPKNTTRRLRFLSPHIWMTCAAGVVIAVIILVFLPLPQALLHGNATHPLRVLDRHGTLLYEARRGAPGSQEWLPLEQIPQAALDGVLATEDRTFFAHRGVSMRGIARAAVQNLTSGSVISGGSTITQQLVRIRLQRARSLWSKMFEAYYALRLERKLSKEQILEAYLNSAYFGHQAYGLQAAATVYFGKSVHELSLPEIALLIGLLQSPSAYDPFTHLPRARQRLATVLGSMRSEGKISHEQEQEALHAEFTLASGRIEMEAPHFVFWALNRDDSAADVREIRTTLDLDLQHQAERILQNHLETLRNKNVTSAAVIVLDATTGDVLTMIGSADYFDAKHDGAVNVAISPRQPGSAIKPFTYALALSKGDTAATTVADVESRFFTQEGNPYVPRNYDFDEHGLVRYREALANSYNIAAVKVLERVGVAPLLQFLRAAGITTLTQTPEHYGLALTLGDGEVTLLELTRAFALFARGARTLLERSLETDPHEPGVSLLDPRVAWLISDILSDDDARLEQFGTDGPLTFDFPVAVKTGTTRNSRDNWTVGYTPSRIVGVWVGNADNSAMKGTSGVTGAGPIFHDVMIAAMQGIPKEPFLKPKDIVSFEICEFSGTLPSPACPRRMREYFIAGTEPKTQDTIFQSIQIDRRNGLRASDTCPKQFVRTEVFATFPNDVRRYAQEHGYKEPPSQFSPLCLGSGNQTTSLPGDHWLQITRPSDHDEFQLDPLVPDKNEKIVLEANAGPAVKSVEWFINGTKIGAGSPPYFRTEWQPRVGEWRVEARAGELRGEIRISIIEPIR